MGISETKPIDDDKDVVYEKLVLNQQDIQKAEVPHYSIRSVLTNLCQAMLISHKKDLPSTLKFKKF
jgi:hypothetical protein